MSQTAGSSTTTYGYTSGSNRLASITNGGTTTVSTNANGNITSIPPANSSTAATFAYNVANRLASVSGSATAATFVYDWSGQRFSKLSGGTSLNLYSYGQDSALLEESNSGVITDYLYADGRPLATFSPATGTFNYVHDDRLGTPQLATDALQVPSWSTTYQPYGPTPVIVSGITQNLRFPGQYSDLETGFSYNLNRDYMPNIGRYLETDPLGLSGGINTFAYANNNPLKFVDRSGLQEEEEVDPREEETEQENEIYRAEFNAAQQQLRSIDPNNPQLTFITSPGWTPTEQDVENMQSAVQAARVNQCPPPLQRTHPESTLTNNLNRSSYDYWSQQSTENIIRSLRPGSDEPLTVDQNGMVWQGNTRILILEQRGVEINDLPRSPK